MKYSIIVPVYNGEKYLRECLDSIKRQTYTDFEALIINDGSTDSSRAICDEYAQDDKRFKAIHIENGGVSRARNIGLDAAQGDFVCFVDCDDVLTEDFLEYGKDLNEDVVFFGFTRVATSSLQRASGGVPERLSEADIIAARRKIIYDDGRKISDVNCSTVWAKLYKRSLIADIRFPVGIKISEDKIFNYEVFSKMSTAVWNSMKVYYCRTHGGSAMYSYHDGYFTQGMETFELLKKIIDKTDDEVQREYCYSLFSERMVLILKIAIKLDWCHKSNKKPYRLRKREYEKAREDEVCKKLLSECDVRALKTEDAFYRYLYTKSFRTIDLCVKSRLYRACRYLIFRLRGRKNENSFR